MPLVAGEDVNVNAPMARDLDCDVRRRAESIYAQTFAGRRAGNARQPQRAKADDARAEQRRGLFVAESFRNRIDEISRSDDEFGVTAVDQPSSERGVLAKVLFAFTAELAHAASLMQPRDTHAVADLESRHARPDLLDAPDDLMAGNNGQNLSGQFTFDHVQIGAADAADNGFHQDLTRAWLWLRRFGQFERVLFDRRDGAEQTCFHIDLTNRSQPSDAE